MKKQIDVLYDHCIENYKDSISAKKSLEQIHKTIVKVIPEEGQQDILMNLIVRHHSDVEQRGFLLGFRTAVQLFVDINEEV